MLFSTSRLTALAAALGLWLFTVHAPALSALETKLTDEIVAQADSVFADMTSAWQSGDEKAMAALIHPDGLRVTHGGDYDRFTIYSPDQAFYYFQDLFRSRTTIAFKFRALSDNTNGAQSLGMVEWEYVLPGRKQSNETKLVVVLILKDNEWKMSQLNSISQR